MAERPPAADREPDVSGTQLRYHERAPEGGSGGAFEGAPAGNAAVNVSRLAVAKWA